MADGNRRILQDDFSAGAFPLASYDQIPGNGSSTRRTCWSMTTVR
jgi:hypothetical protein